MRFASVANLFGFLSMAVILAALLESKDAAAFADQRALELNSSSLNKDSRAD
jgi:hypothetical protein